MNQRKIDVQFDIPVKWTAEEFFDALGVCGIAYCITPEGYRVMDEDDEDGYDQYLLYLASFVHNVCFDGTEKQSPLSYEMWKLCGMPMAHIPGIGVEGENYLRLVDEEEKLIGYLEIDERMADHIATGLYTGRFTRCKRRKEDTATDDDGSGHDCDS